MASQTTYYGQLQMPELNGSNVSIVSGQHKFTSSATVCTLSVPFQNAVLGAQFGWATRPAKGGKHLWTTAVISSKAIKVQRATGSSSGMTFWYHLIGW